MRKVALASLIAAAAYTGSLTARAQATPKAQPLILQKEQLGSFAVADAARARARKGDCAGALEAFDQAIRTLMDPTLRRDRGLCHEKLKDVYPAIEDYRAYLTAAPDASDADDITDRLDRLERSVGLGGSSGNRIEDPMRTSASATGGAATSLQTNGKYDSARAEEDDDSGPLRRGKGFILGVPYVGVRKWFGGSNFATATWAETVGARFGYSLGAPHTLIAELGFQKFNIGAAGGNSVGGFSTQIAYEARLAFDRQRNIDNLWILGIGIGYEHLFSTSSPGTASTGDTRGGLGPRGRFGYRHNLGPKAALEASLDGGFAKFFVYGSGGGSGETTPWMGLNAALIFGL